MAYARRYGRPSAGANDRRGRAASFVRFGAGSEWCSGTLGADELQCQTLDGGRRGRRAELLLRKVTTDQAVVVIMSVALATIGGFASRAAVVLALAAVMSVTGGMVRTYSRCDGRRRARKMIGVVQKIMQTLPGDRDGRKHDGEKPRADSWETSAHRDPPRVPKVSCPAVRPTDALFTQFAATSSRGVVMIRYHYSDDLQTSPRTAVRGIGNGESPDLTAYC